MNSVNFEEALKSLDCKRNHDSFDEKDTVKSKDKSYHIRNPRQISLRVSKAHKQKPLDHKKHQAWNQNKEREVKNYKRDNIDESKQTIEEIVAERKNGNASRLSLPLHKLSDNDAEAISDRLSRGVRSRQIHTERSNREVKESTTIQSARAKIDSEKSREYAPSRQSEFKKIQPSDKYKQDRKEMMEWLEKQAQFTNRTAIAERERTSYLNNNRSIIRSIAQELRKDHETFEQNRQSESSIIYRRLEKLKNNSKDICRKLNQLETGEEFADELESMIEHMENDLMLFRDHQRETYDQMALEEKEVERELAKFEEYLEKWDAQDIIWDEIQQKTQIQILQIPKNVENIDIESNCLFNRVEEINKRLNVVGESGGWDLTDHEAFLKVCHRIGLTSNLIVEALSKQMDHDEDNNHANNQEDIQRKYEIKVANVVTHATSDLPLKTSEAIRSHMNWYGQYLVLLQQKKNAILEWKEYKKKEKEEILSKKEEIELKQSEEKQLKANERKKQTEKERNEKSIALEKWKQKKQDEKEENEANKAFEKSRREAGEIHKYQERVEVKQKLALYRLQKDEEEAEKKRQENRLTCKAKVSHSQLKNFYTRDLNKTKEKRELLKQRELEVKQITESRELNLNPNIKLGPQHVERDPSRLLKGTTTSLASQISTEEIQEKQVKRSTQGAHSNYVTGGASASLAKSKSFGHIPVQARSIPSWRKGV